MGTTNSSSTTKRVATLYRVSTKKQLDNLSEKDGGDIIGQRKSCMDFIAKQYGWELVKEYSEAGVSGYKVSASDRDVIQQAKRDAEKGLFDVLLVFKFDRLGRKDDETPFVLQWFVKKEIEMWSVVEGQQKIDGHIDKLINYLTFWQASGESENISIRVNEKHSQMIEDGIYRGGTVPFGYSTVKSGKVNKKGKELLEVKINPEQAKIINWIYDLVDQEGYGQYRIAKLLNEKGIKTNTGKNWSSSAINVLLRNPMYKGYMVYARGTDKEVFSKEPIQELIIIDKDKWNRVQAIREKRSPSNIIDKENPCIIKTTKGKLLLVGMTRCGHCGSPLTTTYHKKSYTVSPK